MSSPITFVVLLVLAVVGSAEIGRIVALKRGFNPRIGALVGGLLPLVGIGILLLVERNKAGVRPHGG